MQISCPRCATAYELDERVLPPGGAPVQCTRCLHVFTAGPPPRDTEGTNLFGGPQVPPTPPSAPPEADSGVEDRTQIYGRNGGPDAGDPDPERSPSTQVFGPVDPPLEASSRATQIFGVRPDQMGGDAAPLVPPALGRPPERTQVFGRTSTPGADAPNAASASLLAAVDDPPWASAHRASEGAPGAMTRARPSRRGKMVFAAFAVIALAAIAAALVRAWRERANEVSPEAMAVYSGALTSLRRDDPASLSDARGKLEALLQRWPAYHEARAAHLTAMLFQLDDARMELQRLSQESSAIDTQINRLREQQSPGDWQEQVNVLVDRLGEIKAQRDPVAERTAGLDEEVNVAFRALQEAVEGGLSLEDEVHLVRAQAMYFGVKGTEQALALSERYRVIGGGEGWGDLAWAEYALNSSVSPETRGQAREALEALRAKDPSWVRLYVLIGRLALADNALDAATTAFESAVTLNPKHQTGRSLLSQIQKLRKHAAVEHFAP